LKTERGRGKGILDLHEKRPAEEAGLFCIRYPRHIHYPVDFLRFQDVGAEPLGTDIGADEVKQLLPFDLARVLRLPCHASSM
jgi:hypothetical protein